MTNSRSVSFFRDRLTGIDTAVPQGAGTLFGRWTIDGGGQEVLVNSAPAEQDDFLVPDPSGQWHILTAAGERFAGRGSRSQLPDDLEADSIRTIGDALEVLIQNRACWLDWLEVVPLVPGISDQVDLQGLELSVRERFGHLEAVCRKPRAHLHVEVERLPVSKARRIPPAAAAYLASHTEDWDRPLLRGIMPKRILAEVHHDQLDIYENRVTARLLDNLSAYLNRRTRVLRRLLKVFREKEDFSGSIKGTYQRYHRISRLWGESIDANEGRKRAESTLKELEWLKYKILGLLGSTLYGEVPRRAYVPTTLRNTNILTNDPHYRRIADLWREWARTGAGLTRGPKERHNLGQRLCRGMNAFAVLLTVRALDALGYEPCDAGLDRPIECGVDLRLLGHGIAITVGWREDGTVAVLFDDRELKIVALATAIGAGKYEHATSALKRLKAAADDRPESDLLVLHIAAAEPSESLDSVLGRSLHTVGNDPRNTLAGGGCLPVSPWEIGSTERLARALRWFLGGARFRDYPQRTELPDEVRRLLDLERHRGWLVVPRGDSSLELRRPPANYEWDQLDVDSLVDAARAAVGRARGEHQRISDELRKAVRDGRTGALNRQKREAHENLTQCVQECDAMERVAVELRAARERSAALLVCPSCGVVANPAHQFEPRERGCFRCVCQDCSTTWGTRLCGNGHQYATMLPSGDFVESEDDRPGWEDRIYGSDILALPARRPEGGWGFACPECGHVS